MSKPSEDGTQNTREQDVQLMDLVAAKDPHAQSVVANRLVGRVQRLSRMLMRGAADADDAAQQALLEILNSARTYGGRSSVERWSDRITARTVIRYARDQRRKQGVADAEEILDRVPALAADQQATEATPKRLEQYLRALPEAQREVLVMKHSLGYTVEEIAESTGTPVGTVKDRLVTARRQLRRLIQRDMAILTHRTEAS